MRQERAARELEALEVRFVDQRLRALFKAERLAGGDLCAVREVRRLRVGVDRPVDVVLLLLQDGGGFGEAVRFNDVLDVARGPHLLF